MTLCLSHCMRARFVPDSPLRISSEFSMQMFPFYHTAPIQHVQNRPRPMCRLFPNQTTECDYILNVK